MPGHRRSAWLLSALAVLTVACGSTPPRPSESEARAVEINKRAQSAYRAGDLPGALALYRQALATNRAIENVGGIAAELMNIAAVERQLGAGQRAHAALDEILVMPAVPFSGAQRAEAAYRKAYFFFEDGQRTQASEWLEQARVLCGAKECAADGMAGNLRARIALERSDAHAALGHARAALAVNQKFEDRAEQGNSLRLMGDAALTLGASVAAEQSYSEALALDKALGLPSKIVLDLIGVGHSLRAQGRHTDAAEYFRRAQSAAVGAGDEAAVERTGKLLNSTGP
jgi:tetratricopeptide (TPR) repeat protein